jgi:N,N'-diacetylchitobiose transport system permease protein
VSTAPSSVVAGGRALRAPRGSGGSGLRTVHRAVSRLTLPVLLLLPALTVMVGLVGWPLVRTVWLSFTDTRLGDLVGSGTGEWSGLDNYRHVFTDEHLRASLINTVLFGSVCVVGTMIFGFAVALLLHQRLRANAFFGIAVLLPWAVPAIAASAIWRWLFDSRYGFVNWGLTNLGFDRFQDYAWFASKGSAYTAIFVTVVWQSFPFIALSILAGLQTVPKDVLDAAAVDGASATQRFRLVTLPLLRPIIAVLVVFSTIWDFRIFDQVYVMAQGVPDRAADTAAVTAYRESFALGHYGVGAAIAVVLFAVLLALSLLYVRLIGREGEV